MQAILDSIRIIYTLVVTLAVGVEGSGAGPEKRAAVVAQVLAIIDEPGGIEVPAWLRAMLPVVLPLLGMFWLWRSDPRRIDRLA